MKVSLSLIVLSLVSATSTLAMPAIVGPTPANPLKTIELQQRHELEKRQLQLIPMAVGVWLTIAAESSGKFFVSAIAKALNSAFGKDHVPWHSGSDKCTISFSTHAGGECKATINAKGVKSKRPSPSWNACAWLDPEHTDPPVQYFSDRGVGDYSIQFTATNKVAWGGIQGTVKCSQEGLCHPRITFYRKQHSIILDTWVSVGDPTKGQYLADFGGLCGNGPIKNQFRSKGNEMGYDCGIPCEGATDLPSTHKD